MSHIFISYAHEDKAHLDRLLAWLQENDFTEREIWYDQQIEGGNNWRDDIATALDEAFAVLVMVTTNSVNSLYCTYEWAYAMGQGIPTLPLVFDDVNLTDVPTPLTSRQFVACTENIPDHLKEQVQQLRSVPPQIAAINKLVYETIYDTHRQFFVLGWLGDDLKYLDPNLSEDVLAYFIRKASEAHQTLQSLMVDKAFAFSGKQYRFCWQLIDLLHDFSRLQYKYENYLYDKLFPQFDNKWLPAFEYFERDGRWRKATRRYFEWDLENESNRMKVFAEIIRVFPILDVSDADMLVNDKKVDQHRNQSE